MIRRLAMTVGAIALVVASPAFARHHHSYGPESGSHYTNVDGNSIHSPMRADHRPAGATAHCADGTWSFSQHRRGTCSHHGGIG